MTVSIIITTRNRVGELERTLGKIQDLVPPPHEVLVCADGCTDETATEIKRRGGNIKLVEHLVSMGSVASRDELIRMAESELVLCLDDDSYPEQMDALLRIGQLFEKDPELAVAVFPQRSEEFPESLTGVPVQETKLCGSYVSSGAVIRRNVFLKLGGYPGFFFHAYEEPDFALRCVAGGYKVLQTPAITIRHHYSSRNRNEIRIHHLHARNEQWSVWMRCPMLLLIPVAIFRAVRQMMYAISRGPGWLLREPLWWMACIRGLPKAIATRRAVPAAGYLKWMRLVRRPEAA